MTTCADAGPNSMTCLRRDSQREAPRLSSLSIYPRIRQAVLICVCFERINLRRVAQKCDRSVRRGNFGRRINRLWGRAGARSAARRALAKMRAVEDIACFQWVARNSSGLIGNQCLFQL